MKNEKELDGSTVEMCIIRREKEGGRVAHIFPVDPVGENKQQLLTPQAFEAHAQKLNAETEADGVDYVVCHGTYESVLEQHRSNP